MKYIANTTNVSLENDSVVTLGKFDGLHEGHHYLIDRVLEISKEHSYDSVVFTFTKPPLDEIEQTSHFVLSTLAEKESIFQSIGIDVLVEFPFTKDVMQMKPEDFVRFLLKNLRMKALVVGDDFCFGYRRSGNVTLLKELSLKYGFSLYVVSKKKYHGVTISSTLIRNELQNGNLELVKELLGYPYFIKGTVEEGNKIGRNLGFPTANITPDAYKLLPPFGVYFGQTFVDGKKYYGMINLGVKPTIKQDHFVNVEMNLFDFAGNLYDKTMEFQLLSYLRGEVLFESLDGLKNQLSNDKNECYRLITKY